MFDTFLPARDVASEAARLAEEVVNTFSNTEKSISNLSCVALLDPALWHPDEDKLLTQSIQQCGSAAKPIQWDHPSLVSAHRPLLLPFDPQGSQGSHLLLQLMQMSVTDMAAESLQQGNGQRVSGILLIEQDLSRVASHLGRVAVQTLPSAGLPSSAGRYRLLRFFDPMVTSALWEMSSPAQRATWFGPVVTWMSLKWDLSFRHLQRPEIATRPSDAPPLTPESAWGAAQWLRLLALSAFNPVALELGIQASTIEMRPMVLDTLCRLITFGVHESDDLKTMARFALTRHPVFDEHPKVRHHLMSRPAGMSAGQSLSALSDDDWQGIQNDLRLN